MNRKKHFIGLSIAILIIISALFLNNRYEVVTFHPNYSIDGPCDLKVLTWNVHCPIGTDSISQRRIAEVILQENADFVQLNEYQQDSCSVIDSLLKMKYPYTEEYQSRKVCGDIFYSKNAMSNSGHVWIPVYGKSIPTLKATIAAGQDSLQVFGIHMVSNGRQDNPPSLDSLSNTDNFYDRYRTAQKGRSFQAHWTKVNIIESQHPVIVMGDLNDFNCSAPLDTLTSCGLKDSWWEGGNGYGCTFHSGWMRLRIDYILHSEELKLQSIKVIKTDLSDHNPIVATFSLQ